MAEEIVSEKRCSKCRETKSLDDFYHSPKSVDKRKQQCKTCWDNSTWARYATPEYVREAGLWQKYGLTAQDYDALFEKQGRACAICKQMPERYRLHVDHCHETGRVRGLLCVACNTALGLFKDSVSRLQAAITYLESVEGAPQPTRWTYNLIVPKGDRRRRGDAHPFRNGKQLIGEKHGMAIFTEEQIREFRRRYDSGEITSTALAKEQGVPKTTMQAITSRRNWKHVE